MEDLDHRKLKNVVSAGTALGLLCYSLASIPAIIGWAIGRSAGLEMSGLIIGLIIGVLVLLIYTMIYTMDDLPLEKNQKIQNDDHES